MLRVQPKKQTKKKEEKKPIYLITSFSMGFYVAAEHLLLENTLGPAHDSSSDSQTK